MTVAETFQQAYTAFLNDYNAKVVQISDLQAANAALQAQNALLQARIDGLVALIDQAHLLAHAPLA